MDEKKRSICDICINVGIVLLLMYIILLFAGSTTYILAIRLILAVIATIAFAINFGIEIHSSKNWGHSVLLYSAGLFCIIFTVVQLI